MKWIKERWPKFKSYICEVLFGHNIPVWMTLFLVIAGAVATYFIAPSINQKFELQRARREFLVGNLNSLAGDTKHLLDEVSAVITTDSDTELQRKIELLNPLIAKLQFSAVQLVQVVPESAEDIVEFQRDLQRLQTFMTSYKLKSNNSDMLSITKSIGANSLHIYGILLKKAGIS